MQSQYPIELLCGALNNTLSYATHWIPIGILLVAQNTTQQKRFLISKQFLLFQ